MKAKEIAERYTKEEIQGAINILETVEQTNKEERIKAIADIKKELLEKVNKLCEDAEQKLNNL